MYLREAKAWLESGATTFSFRHLQCRISKAKLRSIKSSYTLFRLRTHRVTGVFTRKLSLQALQGDSFQLAVSKTLNRAKMKSKNCVLISLLPSELRSLDISFADAKRNSGTSSRVISSPSGPLVNKLLLGWTRYWCSALRSRWRHSTEGEYMLDVHSVTWYWVVRVCHRLHGYSSPPRIRVN